ncbi:hypothetical protein EV06_0198 [Prochlorococcus sp. MIT 0602]|nr:MULTISPECIES: DUF1499 domain-containing protein [unclassified Prochlorococcus]KGG16195.1 hypothetical protein EV07_1362 [Prochlorococcus sp. MIT 0603]KGG18070.1 hypothetical protein EV06_0198 [Prochlorococcus sp. MIT 0602]
MALDSSGNLSDCLIKTNCIRVEWSFSNLNESFDALVNIASSLPRVTKIESNQNYWHGVVRSFVFRFPDDLEILKIPSKKIIQVKSASRIGVGDLGVNQKRIKDLYSELQKSI